VGLIVVAYEVRQNTTIAAAEYSQASYDNWMQLASMEAQSDVGEIFIKAIEDPDSLSKQEIFKLNAWLLFVVSIYDNSDLAADFGVDTSSAYIYPEDARYYFSNAHSRLWFESNKYWIRPRVAAVISKEIQSTPISTEWNPQGVIDQDAN